MASRADEIQKLIADIDDLLAQSSKRLPRLLPGQVPEGREVLQRVREFLAQLAENEAALTTPIGSQPLSSLLERFIEQGQNQTGAQLYQATPKQDNFEAKQLKSEFSELLQPLQAEISQLLQERTNLVQEIRELEQKRLQNYSLTQQLATQEQMISEFLQTLMSRLTANLTLQSAQNLDKEKEGNSPSLSAVPFTASVLEPVQQLERLTSLTRELDQHLLSLDGTVNVVFTALQNNINTYYQSLSESLARMHNQGLQGEQVMANLLNNIIQYSSSSVPEIKPTSAPIVEEIAASTLNADRDSLQIGVQEEEVNTEDENIDSLGVEIQEEEVNTEDLEAVLSDLNLDESLSLENGAVNLVLPSASDEATAATVNDNDQVDELYASLFGTAEDTNLPDPSQVTSELLDLSNTEIESEEVTTSPVLELSDAWTNQQDLSLLPEVNDGLLELASDEDITDGLLELALDEDITDSFLESALDEDITDSLLESALDQSESSYMMLTSEDIPITTETAVDDSLPDSGETITVLTDLLVDVSADQSLLELPSWSESPGTTTVDLTPVTTPVISHQRQDILADNYIPASPKENLLSWENTVASSVPEIFLDEGQLQRLDRDLANFDRQSLESSANLQDFQNLLSLSQNSLVANEVSTENLVESGSTSIDLSPEMEKKKEDSSGQAESSLAGNGESLIDTDETVNLLDAVWYLGLDLGTTGISATLLNRSSSVIYPLYWSAETQPGVSAFDQSFRLPAEVYLPTASVPHSESDHSLEQISPVAAGQDAESMPRLYSAQLKPYLQVAIPYKSDRQKWEPVLKLNESSAGPLIWVVRSLSKLLSTLKSVPTSTTPALIAHAVGLEADVFSSIINKIAGVICTCPASWSEQYRFNVREAILSSQLVSHSQQVFFVEEAIASLLPEINGANGELVKIHSPQGLSPLKASDYPLLGNTLVINIGATATEMVLVDLPTNKRQLIHKDFMLHSFNYAGKGMEQDIICQLLLPPKSRQPRPAESPATETSNNPWHWQPSISGLDEIKWDSLQLEGLELPKVGEPDLNVRIRLQQRLESSPLGQALLEAAVVLKLILQHQETFTLELADQRWFLQRRDVESQVFVPFVRRLNRELNKLLVARGIPTEAINQAILTGGVASIGTVSRWLRQKLPNAKIIQDAYLSENGAPNCSRVAYGLALLPLHPQVLDAPRQQYTDYFLFTELLNLLPDRSLSFGEVLQLFESRGVNTRACQQRLLAFLEGELPAGLIPIPLDSVWLTKNSQNNPDYQAIVQVPLFEKLGNLTYRPNSQQVLVLRSYLEGIKASTLQSLEEPYTLNFVLELRN